MKRGFDWRKAQLLSKPKLSIADEQDRLDGDRAARFLAKAGKQPVGGAPSRKRRGKAKRPPWR